MNRQLLKHKVDTLTETEVSEVLEYISIMESVEQQSRSSDPLQEMILGLLLQAMRDEPWSEPFLRHQKPHAN
jgi:hypothetical protein